MFSIGWGLFFALGASAQSVQEVDDASSAFHVPPGFVVRLFADDSQAHDIYSMTLDAQGRVVVSGPGYVRILLDHDQDGRADEVRLFSDLPKSGAQGMVFDGPDLVCTGDGAVLKLRDRDADGAADGPADVWARLKNPEHGAHGLVQGPDGWFYLICGNDAGVSSALASTPTSPVREPRSGALVRFTPDGRKFEVVAHGFRNPYDLDFFATGEVYTVDSDGERDHHLPWYTPTRLFDVAPGEEHGWLLAVWTRSFARPAWFFDSVERAAELGRGSPTGVAVYRHESFPRRYREGVFSACWTLGRVYFCPVEADGPTWKSAPEVFLATKGEVGFAPVDVVAGREGEMYVAVGGRGTRGSVFCVRYTGQPLAPGSAAEGRDELQSVLDADEPLAAWSRADWVPAAHSIGRPTFVQAALDGRLESARRVRAVEILVELFGGLSADEAGQMIDDQDRTVAARACWSLGRKPKGQEGAAVLFEATRTTDDRVARYAWESLASLPPIAAIEDGRKPQRPDWRKGFTGHRRVQAAAVQAARGPLAWSFEEELIERPADYGRGRGPGWPGTAVGRMRTLPIPTKEDPRALGEWIQTCLEVIEVGGDEFSLVAIRLLQLAQGDLRAGEDAAEVFGGYQAQDSDRLPVESQQEIVRRLAPMLPSGRPILDLELARLFAMLRADDPQVTQTVVELCRGSETVEGRLHYMIVLSQLTAPRDEITTESTADALLSLDWLLAVKNQHTSRNWSLRVDEMFDELRRRDPALADAVADHPEFGRAGHAHFVGSLPNDAARRAAERLLAHAEADGEEGWTPEIVEAVSILADDRVLPVLRSQWDSLAVRESVAGVLAGRAAPEDRARLVEALASPQPSTAAEAARALSRMEGTALEDEIATVFSALSGYLTANEYQPIRRVLVGLLEKWTGARIPVQEPAEASALPQAYRPWYDWFQAKYPDRAASLATAGEEWRTLAPRLEAIDWSAGDSGRGRAVYEKKSCHRCHAGQSRLGPDLAGAASRLSRRDLFAAIVEPSREVAPPYRATLVETRSGKIHHGLVIYESPEATLLETSPGTTVRIGGDEFLRMQPSTLSLMPAGLLNDATDQDLADLDAWLRTLGADRADGH
jgi:putative membrane-bound dehydrogenase-like protein